MKEGTLVRVLFCKINCPLICFCKPPAHHLKASGRPLKLPTPFADSCPSDKPSPVAKEEEAANGNEEEPAENALKSCIKKLPNEPVFGEKRVQWRDNIGKQLAEIKEFESSIIASVKQGTLIMKRKAAVVFASFFDFDAAPESSL